jgi:hypothetical protein
LLLKREKPHAMALMAWIAAHAASNGTGIAFDARTWASLKDEVGLSAEEGRGALDALIAEGLVTAVGQETAERLIVRAVI